MMMLVKRYKYVLILLAFMLLFFNKCYHFDPNIDDFDETIIPTLSEFRDIYNENKDTLYGKYVSEQKIISLCEIPDNLKSKLSHELISKLCMLEKKGKIQRVVLQDDCVNFNIKVYNNSIIRKDWLELALVHAGNITDENLCSNDLYRRAAQTKKIKDGWTLILYEAWASWRG